MYTPFLIGMDHVRISGTESSSVIISQTKLFKKLKSDPKKCRNKLKVKKACMLYPCVMNAYALYTRPYPESKTKRL